MTLVLASSSPFRKKMLSDAGLKFETIPARLDERAVEAPLREAEMSPADIAEVLALAKAEEVSTRNPAAMVIGCDQVLALDGEILHKPEDMEAARRRLLLLSGKTHELQSAVVLVREGAMQWSHVEQTRITFRELSPRFIGRYLASVGEKALGSVGAYQIEAEGIQLVSRISGDFFSTIGLPLIPLLNELRNHGLLED